MGKRKIMQLLSLLLIFSLLVSCGSTVKVSRLEERDVYDLVAVGTTPISTSSPKPSSTQAYRPIDYPV